VPCKGVDTVPAGKFQARLLGLGVESLVALLSVRLGVFAVLSATLATPQAAGPTFDIAVDSAGAPQFAAYGERAQVLCREWYPKIDALLFGPDHQPLHRKITIVIDPAPMKAVRLGERTGLEIASSSDGVIRLHAEWLANDPADFDRVVVHELTHVNEDNHALRIARCDGLRAIPCFFRIRFSRPNHGMEWVSEALCDYVAYAAFEKTLEPRLRLDGKGVPAGYDATLPYLADLERAKVSVARRGYLHSYTVGASFLMWLARTKDEDIVRKLNVAMTGGRCSPELLRKHAGAPLDDLWREFVGQDSGDSRR
jgi:hypothetical protein